MEESTDWEYCSIDFQLRYKGEEFTRGGMKQAWLVFRARRPGSGKGALVRESHEIPVPANLIGGDMTPKKTNPSHLSAFDDLMHGLRKDGWQPMPPEGGAWWSRRLRKKKDIA